MGKAKEGSKLHDGVFLDWIGSKLFFEDKRRVMVVFVSTKQCRQKKAHPTFTSKMSKTTYIRINYDLRIYLTRFPANTLMASGMSMEIEKIDRYRW